jgi:ATP-binding cassette subfamily B protein
MARVLRRTGSLAWKHQPVRLVILILLSIVTGAISYLQNGLFARLIDATIAYTQSGTGLRIVFITAGLLIGAGAVPSVVGIIDTFVDTTFRFNFITQLDLYFFGKISLLDVATVESSRYQELMQKANERGTSILYNFLSALIDNFSNLIGVGVSLGILAFIDRPLLLYAFLGALPGLYAQLRYGKDIYWIWDLNANNRRKYFNRRGHFYGVTDLSELKLYQLGARFLKEIRLILESFDDELKGIERQKLASELLALIASVVFLGLGMWRIVGLALSGAIPIGQMLFAYTTYRGFQGTLQSLFRRSANIAEFANYAEYWFDVSDLEPAIRTLPGASLVERGSKPPRIEFRNVSFRYSPVAEAYAVRRLSITIEPGQKVAIVGLSGAGKTTFIKLLCRVYDPEEGEVLVDGKNLKELDLESWQRQIGILFQDFATYEFPVREAIAISDTERPFDENRMLQAARMAKADDFIERLPKKYDQLLWKGFEDGVDLSKGEKQRMALARVLYRESPITILDEPTASVDALAEQDIFNTLERLPDTRTVILISHRFSTVKHADTILVIEHGKLIEQGTHDELMQQGGRYAELYKIQAESYA